MSAVVIIFMIVATVFALATLAYVAISIAQEIRHKADAETAPTPQTDADTTGTEN